MRGSRLAPRRARPPGEAVGLREIDGRDRGAARPVILERESRRLGDRSRASAPTGPTRRAPPPRLISTSSIASRIPAGARPFQRLAVEALGLVESLARMRNAPRERPWLGSGRADVRRVDRPRRPVPPSPRRLRVCLEREQRIGERMCGDCRPPRRPPRLRRGQRPIGGRAGGIDLTDDWSRAASLVSSRDSQAGGGSSASAWPTTRATSPGLPARR